MKIDKKIKNLIFGMFDTMIQGADKYISESSTWLIFTEERRWVIEFTNTKTLWFNYHLFQSELNLLGMDCVESKDIIKEWFESRFFGIDVVEENVVSFFERPFDLEETIQNGVKGTWTTEQDLKLLVEDTIQNGVKKTSDRPFTYGSVVEETIQNGVKLLMDGNERNPAWEGKVQDAIQNGVKETKSMCGKRDSRVNNTIENGVKDISNGSYPPQFFIEDIIQNGVKEVEKGSWFNTICADEVIDNGKKDIYPIYGVSDKKIEETIQNGVKETCGVKSWGSFGNKIVEHTIQTGVKQILVSTLESFLQEDHKATSQSFTDKIEDAIDNGVKTVMQGSEWFHQDEVNTLIENRLKE
jgi:hypothetical protein